MNHRVLELLKAPKNIQSEDLNLLKEEINSFPYVQNIRALYLYGVHLYDKENYQKVLSATAAYTTDKKILYQLINGKIQQNPLVKSKPDYAGNPLKILYKSKIADESIEKDEEIPVDNDIVNIEEVSEDKKDTIIPVQQEEIKHIFVNGERNRILFEGEENFLNDNQSETIDLESTLEFGTIVTQKVDKTSDLVADDDILQEEISVNTTDNESVPEIEEFIPEIVVGEENMISEQETVLDDSQQSFEEIEPISTIENDQIKSDEIVEFTPETIIEEENINLESEQEEVLNESQESFEEIESVSDINEFKENADSKYLSKIEETEEFIPETIVEEENITSESEKAEILDESESSFEEIQPIISEVQNNDVVENKVEEEHSKESKEINETPETAEFTPETIINEDEISSDTEAKSVNDESELSFHGTESFLPDVKMQVNNSEEIKKEISESNINKHEDEMRRLIEEVEKKMKEKMVSTENKKEKEPENIGNDISFAETQSFNFIPVETKVEEEKAEAFQTEKIEDKGQEVADEKSEPIVVEEPIQINTSWKPMSFESNLPDSMIEKTPNQPKSEPETQKVEEIKIEGSPKSEESLLKIEESELAETSSDEINDIDSVNEEIVVDEEKEDVPVMNVSFFGSDISKWTAEDSKKEIETEEEEQSPKEIEIPVEKVTQTPVIDSNVPGFINTWQSWLKIDRTNEVEKEKEIIKTKAIETFIENNPKISQLKDESSYIVKEKNDDISHLMTETLAILYFEQKLYTKAIKAFEILIKKSPEKEEYFRSKIQEIKDFRSKGLSNDK